jgi:hypothetical protein
MVLAPPGARINGRDTFLVAIKILGERCQISGIVRIYLLMSFIDWTLLTRCVKLKIYHKRFLGREMVVSFLERIALMERLGRAFCEMAQTGYASRRRVSWPVEVIPGILMMFYIIFR